jgi:uncharacterized membrane protein
MIASRPMPAARPVVLICFVALIVVGLAWELWLAPLRPGGSLMALKVVPLVLALPSLARGRVRAYQWWSMIVLVYLAEGLVRATSDRGPGIPLGWIEAALATIAFGAILLFVRPPRAAGRSTPDRAR